MSRRGQHRLLVVSDSEDWREAMTIGFEARALDVVRASGERSVTRAQETDPEAIVVDVDGGMQLTTTSDRFDRVAAVAAQVRAAHPAPIVLVTSVPMDELNVLGDRLGHTSVMLARSLDAMQLAAEIVAVLPVLDERAAEIAVANFATVELTIREATLQCEVRAGGKCQSWDNDWKARRQLDFLNEEFSQLEESEENFRTLNIRKINNVGRLLLDVFEDPLDRAVKFCKSNLSDQTMIHHRIVLDDDSFGFVPFEIVTTQNPAEYLRFVNPIARRLIPRQEHRSPDRMPVENRPHRRVLFIFAGASGVFKVAGETIKGRADVTLPDLAALRDERDEICALYRETEITVLELKPEVDNIKAITDAFASFAFDIVHFAGHSVRSDSRRVFLALPAPPGRPIIPYDIEDFARLASEGDTRLVILSSCEGASGLAMSRMASRGIPAVIGFRWPVIDADARIFTVALHRELRRKGTPVPVSTAFHHALLTLRQYTPQRLTGFSPVLTIQRQTWHDYTLEG